MKKRMLRPAVVAVVAVALTVPAMIVGVAHLTKSNAGAVGKQEFPSALARHLDQLGQGRAHDEQGPETAAEAEFMQRAYPNESISVEQAGAASAAFASTTGRAFPRGKGRPGTWVTVGPSEALYPSSQFLTSFLYVPNSYVAGGRTTASAIASTCKPGNCLLYIATAGGGVWRTKNALDGQPHWVYLSGPAGINSTGAITIDPNDPSGNTIWVGTGEANICGSGCVAGVGLYKSTDGGDTWTGPIGKPEFAGNGIGQIAIKPGDSNTLYVGSTTALRGMSSVCCSGVTRPVPGAAKWGLYKSTNGGSSWTFIHNGAASAASCTGSIAEFNNTGACSPRGVRAVVLDPSNPNTLYAASYARGVWRSTDAGAMWTQIKPSLNSAIIQTRPTIAVNTLPNGKTRMYVYEGNTGGAGQQSRLFRSDDVATGVPTFTDMTSSSTASPGWAWFNLCGAQCWYDQFVYSPKGYPDIVYVGGSYSYGQTIANKRGVVLSTDGGLSGTDMTFDGTDELHPNGLHPDQHSLVTNPNNPLQFFETNDGGIMRSSGELVDRSAFCDDPNRGLGPVSLARCKQMLSAIPSKLESMNKGLTTLQFQSLSVSHFNSNLLQGGTQDNGTWQSTGTPVKWENKMIGDGGQSGFDVAVPGFRFHNFTGVTTDVNFNKGDIADWIWISDPVQDGSPGTQFYAPVISDPKVSGTLFAGTGLTVYRTKTFGFGTNSYAVMNEHCNEWTGDFPATFTCGDWTKAGAVALTDAALGSRAGGGMSAVERTAADTKSAWAATTTGRVFVSKNVDADPASAVSWTRIDNSTTPDRFVSSIYVDPTNGNHAWISYSGYDANTPATPGHLFEVTYNPIAGTATWVNRSYDWGDLPANDVALDSTGDVYASSDFGVAMLPVGTTSWVLAAPGMPNVEVAGLTILPNERILYAATHGLGAWRLNLP
ncbi:MAG: exo-alpha-sialidase [Actinomycetota bacterium]|nr:exo-alpha-sialidase [Actinomycetota bacterium]